MRADKAIKFMLAAQHYAQLFSKDNSTQVGAFFVDPNDFTQLTQGYNGMPRGVDDHRPDRLERPAKYMYFEHAERNGIYNLARRHLKESLFLTLSVPSFSCARAAISVGAKEIWFPEPVEKTAELSAAMELFEETGVTVRVFNRLSGELICGQGLNDNVPVSSPHSWAQQKLAYMAKAYPSQCVTAILSGIDGQEVSRGYAGMPNRAVDERAPQPERYVGEHNHMWVESSLRNAIYRFVRPLLEGSVCLVTATTCVECARAIASVGCSEVVYVEPAPDFMERWGQSIEAALTLLDELGVKHSALPQAELDKVAAELTAATAAKAA